MLTILIPCFNEETLIEKTFTQVNKSLKILDIKNYEIIFIDDGSTDKSFEKINEIAKIDERVITIKNKRNYGLGYNIQKGIRISRGDYFIFIPGDNSHSSNEIIKILEFINSNYDLITTYYSNRSEQSFLRHIFTRLYTPFLNFLYGTNFYYFNGLTLYKTKDLKNLKFINNSFSFQIEIFVYLFYKEFEKQTQELRRRRR